VHRRLVNDFDLGLGEIHRTGPGPLPGEPEKDGLFIVKMLRRLSDPICYGLVPEAAIGLMVSDDEATPHIPVRDAHQLHQLVVSLDFRVSFGEVDQSLRGIDGLDFPPVQHAGHFCLGTAALPDVLPE
jgi:hypothetical protein